MKIEAPLGCWKIRTRVRKIGRPFPIGRIVGYYSTETTDVGYCVEFRFLPVQIFPTSELEFAEKPDAQ